MSFDGRADAVATPRVAIIAALGLERATLLRRGSAAPDWQVAQSGPGPTRAAQCAERAVAAGARALVSWGLAGGLDAALAPGTLVLPRHLRMHGGERFAVDAAWHARLQSLARELATSYGDLLTVPVALDSPASKAALAAGGAAAVDMESAAVAAVAARAGVPFVAVRVIVDARGDSLPAGAERWIDARGNRRLAAALHAVVAPREWRALWTLAQRYRVARTVLERVAQFVIARRLLVPPAFES